MQENKRIIGLAAFFLVILCLAYSNHFKNGFYFDDNHTIRNNTWIRSLKNIPQFFTNYKTFSIDPNNQGAMRPMVTALNAIDYALAGKKYNQRYFHAHMFVNYLILCVLLYYLILHIFNFAYKDDWNKYIALVCTAWFATLTPNAETINYIIMRADSFSTLCIIATFLMYLYRGSRKYYLYLIPMILGVLTKEVTYVLPFVLFFFIVLFEEKMSLIEILKPKNFGKTSKAILKSLPAFIILIAGILFLVLVYQPKTSNLDASMNQSFNARMDYFMTQSYCIMRYVKNFFIPTDLTADPDIYIIKPWTDLKIVFGLLTLILLFITAVLSSLYKKTRPISFGIIWFYVFLAPTSSFNVMFQISNDHRTFLTYIGLIIAFGWIAALLIYHLRNYFEESKKLVIPALSIATLIICFNAFGTFQRNKVWSSDEKLWGDTVLKSPRNPRALMNYGLVLMRKGQYPEAQQHFEDALVYWPNWFYAHINMGIVLNSQNKPEEAEKYFANALRFGKHSPEPYYFYARYLTGQKKYDQAKEYLQKGKALSPQHASINELLERVSKVANVNAETIDDLQAYTDEHPSDAAYIELSLAYYKLKSYDKALNAAEKAVELNPNSSTAYNNACASLCALKKWEEAANACRKALEITPDFDRAKNNLNWALGEISKKSN